MFLTIANTRGVTIIRSADTKQRSAGLRVGITTQQEDCRLTDDAFTLETNGLAHSGDVIIQKFVDLRFAAAFQGFTALHKTDPSW